MEYGQNVWRIRFEKYFNGGARISDGSCILVSSAHLYGHGSMDIWAVKTDTKGHIEWKKFLVD